MFQIVYGMALCSHWTAVMSQHGCLALPVLKGHLQHSGQSALAKGQLLWFHVLRGYFTCWLPDSIKSSPSDCPVRASPWQQAAAISRHLKLMSRVSQDHEIYVALLKKYTKVFGVFLSLSVYISLWFGDLLWKQIQTAVSNLCITIRVRNFLIWKPFSKRSTRYCETWCRDARMVRLPLFSFCWSLSASLVLRSPTSAALVHELALPFGA